MVLESMVLSPFAQGQKNKSFELQSAPNLHRDKKNKKNNNFRGILAPSQVDWTVFVFFVVFVPVQVWCTLKFKTCVFFCPCAGLVHFEVQNLFFLSLCRFGAAHLWQHFCLICAFEINK